MGRLMSNPFRCVCVCVFGLMLLWLKKAKGTQHLPYFDTPIHSLGLSWFERTLFALVCRGTRRKPHLLRGLTPHLLTFLEEAALLQGLTPHLQMWWGLNRPFSFHAKKTLLQSLE